MTDPQFPEPQPRPRRRFPRAVANIAWLLAGMAVAVLVVADPFDLHPVDDWLRGGLNRPAATAEGTIAAADGQLWTCGMHPQVLEDHPGPCPICGMNLVPVLADSAAAGPATAGERRVLFYRNPMDPTVTSPVPAKDSMGMDYVPVYADEAAAAADTAGPVVTIDPTVVQNMNVEVESIERRDITREIRTVGFLDFDQGKMVTVTTKVRGWVEKVYVNYIGEPVRRGQPLFEIYSPELVQTQQELISALGFARRMADAPPEARQRAEALVAAAETRLGLWDISPAQVERLKAGGEPRRTLTVTSPASGVVMLRKPGLEGMAVEPGAELFHLADLSSLWLSVEVFEDQLPWLSPGMTAQISLSYFPGETFTGRVRYVEPQVAETSRTVGLRLEVPNRDGRLRSGMYATVTFAPVAVKNAVAVPSLAVLRTGERNVVIAALGEGRFAPREVVLGAAGDRYVEVVSGLAAGEQVVTSSQFLLDSESNLREAIQKLVAGRREKGAPAGEPERPASPPPSTQGS